MSLLKGGVNFVQHERKDGHRNNSREGNIQGNTVFSNRQHSFLYVYKYTVYIFYIFCVALKALGTKFQQKSMFQNFTEINNLGNLHLQSEELHPHQKFP